jgi:hypothetical protein
MPRYRNGHAPWEEKMTLEEFVAKKVAGLDELVKAAEALRDFVKKDVRWNHERDRILAELDSALDKVKR